MYEVARGNQVTLGGAALEKARALCRSVGAESRFELLRETLELFGQGWFDRPVGDAPPFRNDITDDGSPFEFSLAFAGEVVELRLLAEAQRAPFNIASNWKAGTLVHKALVCDPNVDIARFASVAELFEPRARGRPGRSPSGTRRPSTRRAGGRSSSTSIPSCVGAARRPISSARHCPA